MCIDISVIVPVFNTKEYLKECLDSVLNQCGVSYEVICVDDGSTDGSYEMLMEYQACYTEKIQVFRQNHGGISKARNYGFEKARGNYIYYMDSDDILKADALCYMFRNCKKYSLDLFFFSFENFADDAVMAEKYQRMIQKKQKRRKQTIKVLTGREQFTKFIQEDEYYVTVWCQCIRKEYALKSGLQFPNVMYFEDQIYTYQALDKAQSVACSAEVLYCKRIRQGSVCTDMEKTNYIQGNMQTIFFLENILSGKEQSVDTPHDAAARKLLNDSKLKLFNLYNKYSESEHTKYLQIMYDEIEKEHKTTIQEPLVSLCIPTSGVEKWLLPVLDSIFIQNVPRTLFEVVITNNGPQNEPLDKEIHKMMSLYGNIKYEYNNSGSFINEIESYKLARGKMIKFINHRTLLRQNALKTYLVTAFCLCGIRPPIYFSNGVLKRNQMMHLSSFDEFLMKLGHWSTWSTGMCFWKEDFEKYKDEEEYNELFPHTNILFKNVSSNYYFINDIIYLHEMPVGNTGKGTYDVFHAFAVDFPKILTDLKNRNVISEDTFQYVKKEILVYIAFMYHGYVLNAKETSYDLSGYSTAINQYYSHEEVVEIVKKKYTIKTQSGTQSRILVIEYNNHPIESVYDWEYYRDSLGADNHFQGKIRGELSLKYKFVRVDILGISCKESNAFDRQLQMRRLEGYLDSDVNCVLIRHYSLTYDGNNQLKQKINKIVPNVLIYEEID